MSQSVFQVISKDPEIQHVTGNMRNTSMHEHGGDQGKVNWNWGGLQTRDLKSFSTRHISYQFAIGNEIIIGKYLCWYSGKSIGKTDIASQSLQEYKDKNIQCN